MQILHLLVSNLHTLLLNVLPKNDEEQDEILKMLLSIDGRNWKQRIDINKVGLRGGTVLHDAVKNNRGNVVQFLLENDGSNWQEKIDVNVKMGNTKIGITNAFLQAVQNTAMVKHFIANSGRNHFKDRLDANVVNSQNKTALFLAVEGTNLDVVKLLLQASAEGKLKRKIQINSRSTDDLAKGTALHQAIRMRYCFFCINRWCLLS